MRVPLRPAPPDLRMSAVGHLEELRGRLLSAGAVFAACFALCLWQSGPLLHLVNHPLDKGAPVIHSGGEDLAAQDPLLGVVRALARPGSGLRPAARRELAGAVARIEAKDRRDGAPKPVTLGLTEPFTATLQVALLFALLLSAPFLLFQIYAYIAPALEATRGAVAAALLAGSTLFYGGAAFGYYVVVPAMVQFLTHFSQGQFTVLVQAGPYYRLTLLTVVGLGAAFQLPLLVLALTASGTITARQLAKARKFVLVACAAVGAMLPGEVVTMALGAAPLYILFELSLLVARAIERRALRAGGVATESA